MLATRSRFRVGPARAPGLIVLIAGLCSALALLAAARFVPGDGQQQGRAALARLSGEVGAAVMLEADSILRSPPEAWVAPAARQRAAAAAGGKIHVPGEPVVPAGDASARTAVEAPRLIRFSDTPPPSPQAPPLPAPTAVSAAFTALVGEARAARRRDEPESALDLLSQALSMPVDATSLGEARLLAIQLGLSLRRPSLVRDQWRATREELHGNEAREHTSLLLLCGLAAAGSLPSDERVELALFLARAWDRGDLALPGEPPRLAFPSPEREGFARVRSPARCALRRRLELLLPDDQRPFWTQREEQRGWTLALADALPRWPPVPAAGGQPLAAISGGWLCFAFDGPPSGTGRGVLLSRALLILALRDRLARAHILPEGFVIDFDQEQGSGSEAGSGSETGVGDTSASASAGAQGTHPGRTEGGEVGVATGDGMPVDAPAGAGADAATRGEIVRGFTPLLGDDFGFRLRHLDPGAFVRRAASRTRWVRAGLALAALFAALASLATFRALRREARLARLKSAFVAGVSHELRTPVASIHLLAENLELGRVSGAAARARYVSLIRREARRLSRLVNDVLDFSRIERGQPARLALEPIDLSTWCAELRDDARALAFRLGAELEWRGQDLREEALLDGEALRRAVLNLVDNAARHGAPGPGEDDAAGPGASGLLHDDARRGAAGPGAGRRSDDDARREAAETRADRRRVTVRMECHDGELRICVRDRGPGIAPRGRERVLQPFVSGGAGNGLGLSLVAAIARGHGGTLRLADPDDGGAGLAAWICLPRHGSERDDAAAPEGTERIEDPGSSTRTKGEPA